MVLATSLAAVAGLGGWKGLEEGFRGRSMTSKPVAFLVADLGLTKTHSRPYTSTDNSYSEAHFKTLTRSDAVKPF